MAASSAFHVSVYLHWASPRAWHSLSCRLPGGRPNSSGVPAIRPVAQSQCRRRLVKPSLARAITTARPGTASAASISVTVLNFEELCATACIRASTEPSERSTVATWLPAFCGTVTSPTWRANSGSPVSMHARLEQVAGLVQRDPVVAVGQVGLVVPAPGTFDHRRHGRVATGAAHEPQEHLSHLAADLLRDVLRRSRLRYIEVHRDRIGFARRCLSAFEPTPHPFRRTARELPSVQGASPADPRPSCALRLRSTLAAVQSIRQHIQRERVGPRATHAGWAGGEVERGVGARWHVPLRSKRAARARVRDRHAATDGQRLAARGARVLLHAHRSDRALSADARDGGLLPDGLGRQRPADGAPRAEPLRRAL